MARINPELRRTTLKEPLRGTGIRDVAGDNHVTNVRLSVDSNVGGGVVGTEMVAKPLGPDHPMGTPPSGKQEVMDLLGSQYIRGHLLNENLGGPGENKNLFPITRSANAMHNTRIETAVKDWVNTQRYWVSYEVRVGNYSGIQTSTTSGEKYINATLTAKAQILDLDLNPWRTITATIASTFDERAEVTGESDTTTPAHSLAEQSRREVRDADRDATVLLQAGDANAVPQNIRDNLSDMLTVHKSWDKLRRHLEKAPTIGPSTALVLQRAYRQTAANYDGSTVHLSDPTEKRLLTMAVGHWDFIMAELAKL